MIVLGTKRFDGIPAAAAAAISQMSSTAARLGGRLIWNPTAAIGPSAFVNSDGSGGATPISGLVGLALDQSGGWGVPGTPNLCAGFLATDGAWSASGTVINRVGRSFEVTSALGGLFRLPGVFPGRPYYLRVSGSTTAASGLQLRTAGGAPTYTVIATAGSFDWSGVVVWGSDQNMFLQLQSPGVLTWDVLEIREMTPSTAISNALTQATTANKPLLVPGATAWANALSFDGNDMLTNATYALPTTDGYFACLTNQTTVAPAQILYESTAFNDSMLLYTVGSQALLIRRGGVTVAASAASSVAANVPNILECGISGGSGFVGVNGVDVTGATAPFTASTGINLMGRLPTTGLQGTCAAMVLTNTAAPNAAERAIIRRGLSAIAGLQI